MSNTIASNDSGPAKAVQLVVYARPDCHLCTEMIRALQQWQNQLSFTFEVIDIDQDHVLRSLYDEQVPVLMAKHDRQEICHYQLDAVALKDYLAKTV